MTREEPLPNIDLDTVSLLVPEAKKGSTAAREQLLVHIQDYVTLMSRQHAPTKLRGKVNPSDIAQQSLAQVIQGFENFRGNTAGEFYTWLRTIVTNEAKRFQRDFHREKRDVKREQPLAENLSGSAARFVAADHHPTPGTNAIAAEQLALLQAALTKLPEDYAEVVRLRSLQRLSFKEVADLMNRSFDSVNKLWYRAILRLQQEMNSDDSR